MAGFDERELRGQGSEVHFQGGEAGRPRAGTGFGYRDHHIHYRKDFRRVGLGL